MRPYITFYRGKKIQLMAESALAAQLDAAKQFKARRRALAAQLDAAKQFKARKSYDVAVILADVVHSTSSI